MGKFTDDGDSGELTAFGELALLDLQVKMAAADEQRRMFDPETQPLPPQPSEEPVVDETGSEVDMMDGATDAEGDLLDPIDPTGGDEIMF
jgi:hypothetical protein